MDIERPLNGRGKRDAPFMAKKLKELDPGIELLITSPAKRAKITAKIFSKEIFGERRLQIEDDLYHASAEDIISVIKSIDEDVDIAAIFGHNPGFTYLANYFSEEYISNVPTTGIVGVQINSGSWANFDIEECKFTHFIYPKYFQI